MIRRQMKGRIRVEKRTKGKKRRKERKNTQKWLNSLNNLALQFLIRSYQKN